MKLTNIILSQAVRLFRARSVDGGNIYASDLVRALEARYGFFEVPRTLADFDLSRGATFLHGHFSKRFVIDKLQIFENGVLAETRATIEQCDDFIDDLVEWSLKELPISIDQNTPQGKAYLSQIEIESSLQLENVLTNLTSLGLSVVKMLESYGQNTPTFQLSGLKLHADVTSVIPLKPVEFVFERRALVPYSSNLYFSSAPLKTTDHVGFLNELETILSP
jgi:hypothetical protein